MFCAHFAPFSPRLPSVFKEMEPCVTEMPSGAGIETYRGMEISHYLFALRCMRLGLGDVWRFLMECLGWQTSANMGS